VRRCGMPRPEALRDPEQHDQREKDNGADQSVTHAYNPLTRSVPEP